MNRRWSESQAKHGSRGNTSNQQQASRDYDDHATVTEDDLSLLCRMHTTAVKNMIRPDTTRIGNAFDGMMARAKVCSLSVCLRINL